MSEIRTRFKDLPWVPTITTNVMVGGAGGIGSWTAFLLARAGFVPSLFDFDTVETHNMGGQLFKLKDIGKSKVVAIHDTIKEFSSMIINFSEDAVESHTPTDLFCISGFDNMRARKVMFESWATANSGNNEAIFIDGRLVAEQLQIFCVTNDKIDRYREHLFDDSEVEDVQCTLKQTSHIAAMIGSFIVSFFTNHITNIKAGQTIREVPFFFEYFVPLNFFTVET